MPRFHEYDEDAICIHCGFDGAESAWLRMTTPSQEREPRTELERFCPEPEKES